MRKSPFLIVSLILSVTAIVSFFPFPGMRGLSDITKKIDVIQKTVNLSANSQWARVYDENEPYCVRQTVDSGFLIAGSATTAKTFVDFSILKLSPDGDIEWQRAYGGEGRDEAISAQQTIDGGYVVAGRFATSTNPTKLDFWVLKLTASGDIEWQKLYADFDISYGSVVNIPYTIIQTGDGGYVVAGETDTFGAASGNSWILKLYPNGQVAWQKTYGTNSGGERATCIRETSDGGYIVLGMFEKFKFWDNWILKLNSMGDIQWQKTYGDSGVDESRSIRETNDGGYIFAGSTSSFNEEQRTWIFKLNSAGDIEWQKTYGRSDFIHNAFSIEQLRDGGYVVGGKSIPSGDSPGGWFTSSELWISKLNSQGEVDWQKAYGYSDYFDNFSMQTAFDGGFVLTSTARRVGFGAMVLKVSPDGNIGPCCGVIKNFDVTVTNTSISPVNTNAIAVGTNAVSKDTSVIPQDTNASSEVVCWEFLQPPENVTLTTDVNRSLFRKEYSSVINWNPNPYNERFLISGYAIYRRIKGSRDYNLIETVSDGIFEFRDGPFIEQQPYQYIIRTVDSEGMESPRSNQVEVEINYMP